MEPCKIYFFFIFCYSNSIDSCEFSFISLVEMYVNRLTSDFWCNTDFKVKFYFFLSKFLFCCWNKRKKCAYTNLTLKPISISIVKQPPLTRHTKQPKWTREKICRFTIHTIIHKVQNRRRTKNLKSGTRSSNSHFQLNSMDFYSFFGTNLVVEHFVTCIHVIFTSLFWIWVIRRKKCTKRNSNSSYENGKTKRCWSHLTWLCCMCKFNVCKFIQPYPVNIMVYYICLYICAYRFATRNSLCRMDVNRHNLVKVVSITLNWSNIVAVRLCKLFKWCKFPWNFVVVCKFLSV